MIGRMDSPIPVYMFVIWHRGMDEAEKILGMIRARFTVLKQFDVTWRPRDYVKNFAAFYGWKSYGMWVGKKHRSGTGVFRVVIVRDEHPAFSDPEKRGIPELLRNDDVHNLKFSFREWMRHSNALHSADNEAETRHNLKALTGQTLEEFLARPDLDGSVSELKFAEPIPYVPYPYAGDDRGPRFFQGTFRLNRIDLFFLPRCGLPTVFSFSFRLGGLFGFAFCIGAIKIWMPLRKPSQHLDQALRLS